MSRVPSNSSAAQTVRHVRGYLRRKLAEQHALLDEVPVFRTILKKGLA